MGLSFWHLLVVVLVILVLFGAGKLPRVMGDLGKGVRNFKAGLDGKDGPPEVPKNVTDRRDSDTP